MRTSRLHSSLHSQRCPLRSSAGLWSACRCHFKMSFMSLSGKYLVYTGKSLHNCILFENNGQCAARLLLRVFMSGLHCGQGFRSVAVSPQREWALVSPQHSNSMLRVAQMRSCRITLSRVTGGLSS